MDHRGLQPVLTKLLALTSLQALISLTFRLNQPAVLTHVIHTCSVRTLLTRTTMDLLVQRSPISETELLLRKFPGFARLSFW
jgi:hypothetical protein